jgi:hypothetical protein
LVSQKKLFVTASIQSFCIVMCLFFNALVSHVALSAEEKKKDTAAAATPPPPQAAPQTPGQPGVGAGVGGEMPMAPVRSLPRHMEFPRITYGSEPSVEGEMEHHFTSMRFWYVAIIASWNPRSSEIAEVFNKNYKQFALRKIGVIALFSNDTVVSVTEWRKKNNLLFLNDFASRNLLDALKNPKVPTVWLVGSQGEILQRLEMPNKEKMLESVQKVMILTGF